MDGFIAPMPVKIEPDIKERPENYQRSQNSVKFAKNQLVKGRDHGRALFVAANNSIKILIHKKIISP